MSSTEVGMEVFNLANAALKRLGKGHSKFILDQYLKTEPNMVFDYEAPEQMIKDTAVPVPVKSVQPEQKS